MAFSGLLGTANSYLSNIALATPGGTTQSLQIRANILGTTTQTVSLKAHIVTGQSIQLRANIKAIPTIQLRANILGQSTRTLSLKAHIVTLADISLRARIIVPISTSLEVDYNILQSVQTRLPISFNATDLTKVYHTMTMKARILLPITAELSVSYAVDYAMPTGCAVRPTQNVSL